MTTDRSDFTQGSILKKLSLFMLPVLGALILQAAYGAVDLLVVGRFGSTAGLSAVSTGSQILNLVTFVVTQLAMGVTVLIARYLGEKRPEQISAVLGGAAVVFTILSVGIFILLFVTASSISLISAEKGENSLIPLRLLFPPNPLRWASAGALFSLLTIACRHLHLASDKKQHTVKVRLQHLRHKRRNVRFNRLRRESCFPPLTA